MSPAFLDCNICFVLYIALPYYSSIIIIEVIITSLHTLLWKSAAWGMQWTECCVPSQFLCWNPSPQCDVLGGGAFGRWLGHEWSPHDQGECPTERALWPSPLPCKNTRSQQPETKKRALARHRTWQHPDFGLPGSRTTRNKFLFIKYHSVYGI